MDQEPAEVDAAKAAKPAISRRAFVRAGLAGAGLAGVGGLATFVAVRGHGSRSGSGPKDRFAYDIGQWARTDPALIGYQPEGTLATGFRGARDMAVGSDGLIHVAVNRSLVTLHPDGSRKAELTLAKPLQCVALDAAGDKLIGTRDRIEVYDPGNVRRSSWPISDERAYITSIAVGQEDVFVADAGRRLVLRFNRDGEVICRIGQKDDAGNLESFVIPSPCFDLAIGSDALLWVANTGRHRLEAYTFDSVFQRSWGRASMQIEGFCGCCNPCHFTLFPDGRFLTCEKGLPRVKVYQADGRFECVVAGPETFGVDASALACDTAASRLGGPIAALDQQERVLVLHPKAGEVRVFVPRR